MAPIWERFARCISLTLPNAVKCIAGYLRRLRDVWLHLCFVLKKAWQITIDVILLVCNHFVALRFGATCRTQAVITAAVERRRTVRTKGERSDRFVLYLILSSFRCHILLLSTLCALRGSWWKVFRNFSLTVVSTLVRQCAPKITRKWLLEKIWNTCKLCV